MPKSFQLSDEKARKLRESAEQLGVTPDHLLEAGIEDFLNQPYQEYQQTLKRILDKNSELYDRLS